MMRSLYSGIAGLKVHQTKMDVIGNNIANVNTVGYKAQSVTFSELFYQTTQIASGANETTRTGGQNAKQIGLGSQVSAISIDINGQGGTQSTGRAFDLMINGNSFFIVQDNSGTYFSKAGNFQTDENGNLVTPSGKYVMGYTANGVGGDLQTDEVRPLQIYSDAFKIAPPSATTDTTFKGNIDCNSTDTVTRIAYAYDSLGTQYGIQLNMKQTDTAGIYTMKIGSVLNGSEVTDYTASFYKTKQEAAAGEETVTFNTGDKVAEENTIYVKYDEATGAIAGIYGTLADAQSGNNRIDEQDPETGEYLNNIHLGFDGDTAATPPTSKTSLRTTTIEFDLSNTRSYAGESTIDCKKGKEDGIAGAGKATGEMSSVGIQTDGRIVASYSNGDTYVIGQIAVSNFSNPAGLEKIGDNLYKATLNSGEFNGIGYQITALGETMSSGVVEMSNVDLSKEFTDMITTQRGFQANSRIITTSDTMLEELVNLKR
ncbi:MAG: flagellar hook protein FlgE [Parasporobacterium sp.]|nr:flagellar hook protein FlgE [Parasporobacterium sp.]